MSQDCNKEEKLQKLLIILKKAIEICWLYWIGVFCVIREHEGPLYLFEINTKS